MPPTYATTLTDTGEPLLLMEPNGVDRSNGLTLQGAAVGVQSGAQFFDKDLAKGAARYVFEFLCVDRVELKALRAFFDAREGRAQGFWFPTWGGELLEVYDYNDPGVLLDYGWFYSRGYDALFATGNMSYRRVLFVFGDEFSTHKILNVAVGVPSAGIDQLGMQCVGQSAGFTVGRPWVPRNGVFCFPLRFFRFDTDEFSVDTRPNGGGVVALPIIETPEMAVFSA